MRPALIAVDRLDRLPASYNQEERVLAETTTHVQNNTVSLGAHFRGSLDVDALSMALALLVARHESLRLTFSVDELGARMHVAETPHLDLAVRQLESVAPSHRVDRALDLLVTTAVEPFNLATGPLVRAIVVRLSDTEHMLGLNIDHILVDAQSCRIVLRDLFALYRQIAYGEDSGLSPLNVQFPDWAAWERRYLQGPTLQRLMTYWRTALAGVGALPAAGLLDRSVSTDSQVTGVGGVLLPAGEATVATTYLRLTGVLWTRLYAFSRSLGKSPFTVCSAVLKATVYLHRRTTQPEETSADVTVFGALANRSTKAVDDVVGYFATSAVLRTDVSGDPTLVEIVNREAQVLFEALAHQELPHPLIAKEISPELYGIRYRSGARVPQYLNFDMPHGEVVPTYSRDGLIMRAIKVPVAELPRSGLRLIAYAADQGMVIELRYRTDRFSAIWVERFVATYRWLLDVWPSVPEKRLSTIAPAVRSSAD
jgi:hypothetical protein